MPHEESFYPSDWLKIAEKDYERVARLLDIEDPEAAGFFLQQSLEKFLKAFLLSNGWRLQRIHDLEALLNMALTYDATLEQNREVCQKVTSFYLLERYPFVVGSEITVEDVRELFKQSREFIEKLREVTP